MRELPLMREGSELFQYHRKIKGDKRQVVPMTTHLIYQTSIEYEVYAIGSLMRGVEYAEETYEDAFNRRYDFSLDPVDVVSPRKKGSEVFFIRLQLEPWMSRDDDQPSAPGIGTDVKIQTRDNTFIGRIVSMRAYIIIMKVKRVKGTDVLVLTEQSGFFRFGNDASKYVAERQAIRGVMWGRMGISQDNWFKAILLAHENAAMSHQAIGIPRPYVRIEAYQRLNEIQKQAFLYGISFGQSPRARITIIQGPPGTGKTEVILTLVLRAMMANEPILICAEQNSAVRLCAGVLNAYFKEA